MGQINSNIFTSIAKLSSLQYSYDLFQKSIPWVAILSFMLIIGSTIAALFWVPRDYQQLDAFRILYVHVPAAIWSLGIYSIIFLQSFLFLVWRIKLCDFIAEASASIGASYTFLALVTGAIWGKPMWGTWWVWDARLTSELLLFFLYCGYLGLRSAINHSQQRAKLSALLAIIGMIDVPIVHFSVQWWSTLHQGATIFKLSTPNMDSRMLYPLLSMIIGFGLFYVLIVLMRCSGKIREQKCF